jgi:hypothetical protein
MSEWVKCTGINGASVLVNLENVLTITSFGTGTRLALSGNSQSYVDVAEAPAIVLTLPRMSMSASSNHHDQEQALPHQSNVQA